MPTRNADLVAQTAEALLEQIKAQAEAATVHDEPENTLRLAQAFALVADADPNPPRQGRGNVVVS